jgi:hypothetical protein
MELSQMKERPLVFSTFTHTKGFYSSSFSQDQECPLCSIPCIPVYMYCIFCIHTMQCVLCRICMSNSISIVFLAKCKVYQTPLSTLRRLGFISSELTCNVTCKVTILIYRCYRFLISVHARFISN